MDYKKEELITCAFEKEYTTWDFFEILNIRSEKGYSVILHSIFSGNTLEYLYFCDQVSLNDKRYLAKHKTSVIITPEILRRMVDDGSNKIDFLRLFGITSATKLYRQIKEILRDDDEGYLTFRKKGGCKY